MRERLAEAPIHVAPGGELELDELRVEAVDGGAPEHRSVGVEEVAVGGIRLEELRHLDDESLEHRLQAQLARHDLSRFEQRRLLLEPFTVLLQELRCVHGDSQLPRDRLDDQDVGLGPGSGLGTVKAEHPDHLVEHEDRRRQHSERVEVDERLNPTQLRILKGRLLADVSHGHRPALACRQVRARKPVGDGVDRDEALRMPFGDDRHRPRPVAEPQEAPVDSDRDAGLLHRHAKNRVEVELGTNLAADRGDEPLAFEGLGERVGRACAVERKRCFGRKRLQERELVTVEHLRCARRREDEHCGDALLGEERDEDGALSSDLVGEPSIDPLRAGDVVHDDRPAFEHGARDSRWLLLEVERHLSPPGRVLAGGKRLEALRVRTVLADQRDGSEIDLEQREAGLEQRPRDGVLVARTAEGAGERGNRCQLPVAARSGLLGLFRGCRRRLRNSTSTSKEHQRAIQGITGPPRMIGRCESPRPGWAGRDRETAIHVEKMGRPAYSHRSRAELLSWHWAMQTAVVRTWPRRPR